MIYAFFRGSNTPTKNQTQREELVNHFEQALKSYMPEEEDFQIFSKNTTLIQECKDHIAALFPNKEPSIINRVLYNFAYNAGGNSGLELLYSINTLAKHNLLTKERYENLVAPYNKDRLSTIGPIIKNLFKYYNNENKQLQTLVEKNLDSFLNPKRHQEQSNRRGFYYNDDREQESPRAVLQWLTNCLIFEKPLPANINSPWPLHGGTPDPHTLPLTDPSILGLVEQYPYLLIVAPIAIMAFSQIIVQKLSELYERTQVPDAIQVKIRLTQMLDQHEEIEKNSLDKELMPISKQSI